MLACESTLSLIMFPLRARRNPFVFIMNKWQTLKSRPADIFTHHTVKIGDGAIFVGVRIEEHLSIGVDGYVSPRVFLVLAQEPGDGLYLGLGLGERATVGVITRVCGGAFFCRSHGEYVISGGISFTFSVFVLEFKDDYHIFLRWLTSRLCDSSI